MIGAIKKGFSILIILIFFGDNSFAQVTESYFSDQLLKYDAQSICHLRFNNAIIVGGKGFERFKDQPTITCLDTTGNVLWNTGLTDTINYGLLHPFIRLMTLGEDGFIYASCIYSEYVNELWKVNPINGLIVWRTSQFLGIENGPFHIIDYDSTKFILTYNVGDINGSFKNRFAFIDKTTGDSISTHFLGDMRVANYDHFGITIDEQKDIYFSVDDTIVKVSGANPDSSIWRINYPTLPVERFTHIYYNQQLSKLFYFSEGPNYLFKINPIDGSLDSATLIGGDLRMTDMVVKDNYMYMSRQHSTIGGGTYRMRTSKYDMNLGSVLWNTFYDYIGFQSANGGTEAGLSIDIDDNDMLYITGYYGGNGWRDGNWGIVKLDGLTGNAIYESSIAFDTTVNNRISSGLGVYVIDNKPYFIGEIQTEFGNALQERKRPAFVKLDEMTGSVVLQKYFGGSFQFPSKTLDVQSFSVSKSVVLKQTGGIIELEMYDYFKNLLWRKTLSKNYVLFGSRVAFATNGTIYVSSSSRSESDTLPYYQSYIDSAYIFKLDSNGIIVNEYSFFPGSNNSALQDLNADNSEATIFYRNGSFIFYRRLTSLGLSPEFSSQAYNAAYYNSSKYSYDVDSNKLYLFRKLPGTLPVLFELNKINNSLTSLDTLPHPIAGINYVQPIDSSNVLLCGYNDSSFELITLYNTFTKDTVWLTIPADSIEQILKCVTDEQKRSVFTISSGHNEIRIRRFAISTGSLIWSYTIANPGVLSNVPSTISYDKFRGHIIVSGNQYTSPTNSEIITMVIDTMGFIVDTNRYIADFAGYNIPYCSSVLPDGSIWIGGNMNKDIFGLAGFIFEIDTTAITNDVKIIDRNDSEITVYPNPFSRYALVHINANLKNASIIIYNLLGEAVKRIEGISTQNIYIDGSGLANDIYILAIIESGNIVAKAKVVVTSRE